MTFLIIGIVVLAIVAYLLINKQKTKETKAEKLHAKNQATKPSKKKKVVIQAASQLNEGQKQALIEQVHQSQKLNTSVLTKLIEANTCFVALLDNDALGLIAWKDKNASTAQLILHWVHPNHRGQKLGLRLLLKFVRTAKKNKTEAIFLTHEKADGNDMLLRFGFTKVVVSKPEFKQNNLDTNKLPIKLRLNLSTWEDQKNYF